MQSNTHTSPRFSVPATSWGTRLGTRLRPRIAALTGLALAALALLVGPAAAQTGPLATSPPQPTPYHSPRFHSGGASTPYTLAGADPLTGINPLFSQLQGTPTAVYPPTLAGVPTQIPSFLLGSYNPAQPPGAPGVYYPEHISDGGIFSWAAPFAYVPSTTGTVTVDDSGAGFTSTGFAARPSGTTGDLPAGTATNGNYQSLPPLTSGTATWTLTATNPGSYAVYFHIPDNIADSTGTTEQRSTNVTYNIVVTTAAGTINAIANASQTDANSTQFLAGPFQLAAGDTVAVTLQRTATLNNSKVNNVAGNYSLIADSMTLQSSYGDVQSTPTAINLSAYPAEFLAVKYWGIAPNTAGSFASATGVFGTDVTANAPPDGTLAAPILRYGDPALAGADGTHLIRQLVFFGRSEPTFTNQYTGDDGDGAAVFTPGPFTTVVTAPDAVGATNGEYRRADATNAPGTAGVWTVKAINGGEYFVTVHLPNPTTTPTPETRITDARYTVSVNGVPYGTYTVDQTTTFSNYRLPTGPIPVLPGQSVVVSLSSVTAAALTTPTPQSVVADSVTINTGTGAGAIYCVDGFTGGVIWRFQTPPSRTGASAPVFSSPAVARINVITGTTPTVTYANKLVVIVGDNNGLVYCLDAVGNGDGTSNANAIDANNPALPTDTGQPLYAPQPVYGGTAPVQVGQAGYTPHVGTTGVYWIYRPDADRPKDVATGLPRVSTVTGRPILIPSQDLPVPAAFSLASPTIYVDPSRTTTPTAATDSNATVYVGNSNGVLYALDALGVAIDGTTATTFAGTGDRFNVSQDLRAAPTVFPAVAADPVIPTCRPKWWFTLRGADPNSGANTSSADIESAPALYVDTTTTPYTPHVYLGSAHEQESTSNLGRLYALNGLYGPAGNNGTVDPRVQPDPTLPGYTGPGSASYNIRQYPTLPTSTAFPTADTADWSFPDGYGTQPAAINSSRRPRPALGNVTGSPVVFTNIHETTTPAQKTRIYFAANVGLEVPVGSAAGTAAAVRPDETQTGRIWAVNLDGSVGTTTNSGATGAVWAYPLANDPNDQTKDTTAEPVAPIGAFLHATPAVGFVQFPKTIQYGLAPYTDYTHTDAFNTVDIKGNVVPMLYIGTRGVNDTALYAVDIDGDMNTTGPLDQRTIYRQISPDGALFQSSPILITNSSDNPPVPPATGPGNGGSVLITSGVSLYDFSATPISNPITAENFPLIRENKAYVGFGPVSGPAVAAADVSDLQGYGVASGTAGVAGTATGNVTDWIYVGDSGTGFCRGITPNDTTDASIPIQLGTIVPNSPVAPTAIDPSAVLRSYLVADGNKTSDKYSAHIAIGANSKLPAYEWGQNVYIRIANVVPPNPTNADNLKVYDAAQLAANPGVPVTAYSDGGPVEFDLSEDDSTSGDPNPRTVVDHATIPTIVLTQAKLPANGFLPRSDNDTDNNLATNAGTQWIAAYTYAISDGSVRRNTPGGHRRITSGHQTVHLFTTTDGLAFTPLNTTAELAITTTNGGVAPKLLPNGTYDTNFQKLPPVDQATFGILNPLGIRGGGIPLLSTTGLAVPVGDDLGPFRGVPDPLVSIEDLKGLANGNAIYNKVPLAGTGAGTADADPTQLQAVTNDYNPPTTLQTVVTSTPLIAHNTSGDNADYAAAATPPQGVFSSSSDDGLSGGVGTPFGFTNAPFAANIFDRSTLGLVKKAVSVRVGVPANNSDGGSGSLYWNDNTANTSGHDSVVNYLPWESAPVGYKFGANSSPDYPNISSQNVAANVYVNGLGSTDVGQTAATLQAAAVLPGNTVQSRTVYGSALQIHIAVPPHQPANQQVYVGNGTSYDTGSPTGGPKPPLDSAGASTITTTTFPMGYITTRRIYVPTRSGRYQPGAAYRDISIYTGVPVDMSTSIANPTTDIGKIPAAFGVQTEQYTPLGLFAPVNPVYQDFFKPLEIHNDGNVNLLNVHLDQRVNAQTLLLTSDAVDPLSFIGGYDLPAPTGTDGVTGPRTAPEEPFLIRSSVDTDLVNAYGRNPALASTGNYGGATFHKPLPGGDSPSILTVPDSPESASAVGYLAPSPTGLPATGFSSPPYVSLAVPFGTPVGTYATAAPQLPASLRLFEGLDTPAANLPSYAPAGAYILYPPKYGGSVGGIGAQTPASIAGNEIYTGIQPISTIGTQLSATVVEQRLTDGGTFGGVPMIDKGSSGTNAAGVANSISAPDFGPAAFRDPRKGSLSVYWTSGRTAPNVYDLHAANVPFIPDPAGNTTGLGYFFPSTPTTQWWKPFTPTLPAGTNSGLSITQDYLDTANTPKIFAFSVNVNGTAPYSNTLFNYTVNPATGALTSQPLPVTTDSSQVKYGVKGLYNSAGFGGTLPNLWAFWTASTRGRTTISYNAKTGDAAWPKTSALLPIPAGLTSVADPSPLLMPSAPGGAATIEVTYSGAGPDGNVDLYTSRYLPTAATATAPATLALQPYPTLTEILGPVSGTAWYQARDAAWARTGALNVSVVDAANNETPLLYTTTGPITPLFTKAIFDKASGLLVLTGVKVPDATAAGAVTTNTLYVDAATGRVRFAPPLKLATTQNLQVRATFNPLAKRLTNDTRADSAPVTFLDAKSKANAAPGLNPVNADRRWTIWRKSGVGGDTTSATLYFKTQRLTLFLPKPIALDNTTGKPVSLTVTGGSASATTVDVDYARGRIYFPIGTGVEGLQATAVYTASDGTTGNTVTDTVQWQDEALLNDTTNLPTTTLTGLKTVLDYKVPFYDTPVNENNVAAFLDPFAAAGREHKVWLFWNSTRNGTADIYSETINPLF